MSPYFDSGSLTTDVREVGVSETWDTQTEWEAYQDASGVDISSGIVSLAEETVPEESKLAAHYDAQALSYSDGEIVTNFADETGNGNDLTEGGSPTFVASGINGNAVVEFDGTDDILQTSTGTTISQPNQIFIVFNWLTNSGDQFIDGLTSSNRHTFEGADGGNEYGMYAGTFITGGSQTTDHRVGNAIYDGANSSLEIDEAEVITGDAGSQSLELLTMGARYSDDTYVHAQVGEVLIYNELVSSESDVYQYLKDKWGVLQ